MLSTSFSRPLFDVIEISRSSSPTMSSKNFPLQKKGDLIDLIVLATQYRSQISNLVAFNGCHSLSLFALLNTCSLVARWTPRDFSAFRISMQPHFQLPTVYLWPVVDYETQLHTEVWIVHNTLPYAI